jgi:hypothetical protein
MKMIQGQLHTLGGMVVDTPTKPQPIAIRMKL